MANGVHSIVSNVPFRIFVTNISNNPVFLYKVISETISGRHSLQIKSVNMVFNLLIDEFYLETNNLRW